MVFTGPSGLTCHVWLSGAMMCSFLVFGWVVIGKAGQYERHDTAIDFVWYTSIAFRSSFHMHYRGCVEETSWRVAVTQY